MFLSSIKLIFVFFFTSDFNLFSISLISFFEILFDNIIISAAMEKLPLKLLSNLKNYGNLIFPKKYPLGNQKLILIKKIGENNFKKKELFDVKFVPLLNNSVQHLI